MPQGDSVPAGLEVLDSGAADTGLPEATTDPATVARAPLTQPWIVELMRGLVYGERCVLLAAALRR